MESMIKERLTAYLKHKGINKSEFGRMVGVSNAYISSIRKSIQPDKTEKIAAAFPDLNVAWLLTGDGEMLKDSVTQISHGDNSTNIAGNGNTISTNTGDIAVLQERVKLLEKLLDEKERLLDEKDKLLAEKERLIKVLMER